MNVCKVSRFVNWPNNNIKNRNGAAMSLDSSPSSRSRLPILIAAAASIALLPACGPSKPPGGGMQMPPAQVVVANVQPASIPIVFEYCRTDRRIEGSRGARACARHPRAQALQRRRVGEVRDSRCSSSIPKPLEAQTGLPVQAGSRLVRRHRRHGTIVRPARLRPLR
jgi:hypothetical protein